MKKYIKYRDSRIEWIGQMPNHWNASKLKWLSEIYAGGTPSTNVEEYWENGTIPWLNSGTVNQKRITVPSNYITKEAVANSSTKWVPKDSLLMALAGQGKTKGIVAILEIDATCNQSMAAIVPNLNQVNSEYLFFWLDSNYNRIRGLAGTELRDGLNLEIVGDIQCPIPPIEEQIKIAKYLNQQTTIIEQLIQKKEKLIELLKEKRLSIINEVVTKGLNPNAKMKNSGIDWLGDIPQNWELRNMETVAKKDRYSITGGPFGSDLKNEEYTEEGVRIIQLQNIGVGEFRDEYKIFTSEEKADYLFSSNIYPGEIIVAKMADPVARACIVPNLAKRFIMASDGIRLEVDKEKYNTKYIEYSINAKYFNYQAVLNSTGTTRLRIGLTTLKKLKLLLPGLEEQNEIVKYLESYNHNFLLTTVKLSNQIEKLKEYRQSIISEAVTGKIDVRDWQPNKQQVA